MQDESFPTKEATLDFSDVLFILFKHKWRILACTVAGILASIAFLCCQLENEYQAKLLVRYVLERSAIDPVDSQVKSVSAGTDAESVINSEVEILTSVDLAEQVAEAIGPERIHPGVFAGDRKRIAAQDIAADLKVKALKGTNVIAVSYRNNSPELAIRVLQELVSRYFDKHLQVHRSLGAFNFVTAQTDQVRTQLQRTEEKLKDLKAKAGIRSLEESTTGIDAELAASRAELHAARVQLAEQRARVREIERALTGSADAPIAAGVVLSGAHAAQQYEAMGLALAQLRGQQVSLLSKFTPENRAVQVNRMQIAELEKRRRQLESAVPSVVTGAALKTGGATGPLSLVSERAQLVACEAKTTAVESHVNEVEARAKTLGELTAQVDQLERDRSLQDANYKYFQASLEKARVDEALDPSKIPNISVVQKPSMAPKDTPRIVKGVTVFAGGAIFAGLLLAFLTELVFDPAVNRAKELETRCGIPVSISIPFMTGERLDTTVAKGEKVPAASGDGPHHTIARSLRPNFADIRDRLAMLFEIAGVVRKPRLIAVAALASGGGASTVAAGLASALSQTSDGKVLLVDMNVHDAPAKPSDAQHPVRSLSEALRLRNDSRSPLPDKLCLATVGAANQWEGQVVPQKFYDMMPELKTSDFDYILFDMPSLDRSSAALAMAALMDKLLLVIEAEVNSRTAAMRAYRELTASKASVCVILNKVRSYGPKWLQNAL